MADIFFTPVAWSLDFNGHIHRGQEYPNMLFQNLFEKHTFKYIMRTLQSFILLVNERTSRMTKQV